jgi:hypothetical protein
MAAACPGSNTYGAVNRALFRGQPNHVDLETEAHAGLFEVLPERAVEQTHGREVLHPGEAEPPEFVQERAHQPEGIRAAHPGEYRSVPDDREHLVAHLDDDRVGVTVGQQPGERAAGCRTGTSRACSSRRCTASMSTAA